MYRTTFDDLEKLEQGWHHGKGNSISEDALELAKSIHSELEGEAWKENTDFEIFPLVKGGVQVNYFIGDNEKTVGIEYGTDGGLEVFYFEESPDEIKSEESKKNITRDKAIEFTRSKLQQ